MEKRGIILVVIVLVVGIFLGYTFSNYKQEQQQIYDADSSYDSIGWQLYYSGDYEGAITEFNKQIENDENNFFAHLGIGYSYRASKDFDNAIQHLSIATSLQPSNFNAHYNLGWAYYDRGKDVSEKKLVTASIADYRNSISFFEEAISISPSDAGSYYGLGLSSYKLSLSGPAKDVSLLEAEEAVTKAIELNPDNPQPYILLGKIYLSSYRYGRDDEQFDASVAQDYFEKSLALKPGNPDAYLGLGWANYGITYLASVDYNQAIDYFTRALELDSTFSRADTYTAYAGLGWSYYWLRDFDNSITYFMKGIELKPNDYLNYLGLGWSEMTKGNIDAALTAFNEAQSLNSNHVAIFEGTGMSYYALQDYTKAIEALQRATELDPNGLRISSLPHVNLGWAYYHNNEFNDAKDLYTFTINNHAGKLGQFLGLVGLMVVYYEEENYNEAEKLLLKIKPLLEDPDYFMTVENRFKVFQECTEAVDYTLKNVYGCGSIL